MDRKTRKRTSGRIKYTILTITLSRLKNSLRRQPLGDWRWDESRQLWFFWRNPSCWGQLVSLESLVLKLSASYSLLHIECLMNHSHRWHGSSCCSCRSKLCWNLWILIRWIYRRCSRFRRYRIISIWGPIELWWKAAVYLSSRCPKLLRSSNLGPRCTCCYSWIQC